MAAKPATSKRETPTGGVSAWPWQRPALCAAVAVLTYVACANILFVQAPQAQTAIVVGIVAGLIGSMWTGGVVAAAVMLLGSITGPQSVWAPAGSTGVSAVLWALLAGGVAVAIAWPGLRRYVRPQWVFWAAVALLVVNLWVTVITVDAARVTNPQTGHTYPSIAEAIGGNLDSDVKGSDEYLYVWVVQQVRSGTPFYAAFVSARPSIVPGAKGATSVFNVREPLLYRAIAAAPSPWLVIGAQLLVCSIAAVGVVPLLRDVVKLPVILPGVALILSFSAGLATTVPLYSEFWVAPLCLIAVELAAMSARSPRWKAFVVGSAAVAALACLVRELALPLPVAGVAASWLWGAEQRRFRLVAWSVALVVAIAGIGGHAVLASQYLARAASGGASHEGLALFTGGPEYALRGFVYGSDPFSLSLGASLVMPSILAALGVVGAFFLPTKESRLMALGLIGAIFALGLVASNQARTLSGVPYNYWGLTSLYVVYGCVPAAFALLPKAAVASDGALAPTASGQLAGARLRRPAASTNEANRHA